MLFASNSHRLVFFAMIYYLLLLSGVNALPLQRRQNTGSQTVTTTRTTQTNAGPVTETCEVTLTPITDKNGKAAVEEVRKCSLSLAGGGTAPGSTTTSINTGTATGATSTTTESVTLTSATSTATTTDSGTKSASASITTSVAASTSIGGTITATGTSTNTATTSQVTSASGASSAAPGVSSGTAGGVVANGVSTRSASATGTTPTTTSAPSPTPVTTLSAGPATSATPTGNNNSGTSAAESTVSASAAAASSTDAFQLPGKKLSVLPIGLGVFAGISVIALIVVGLVTYERTKYRKAFRQRKLAESGASMGYGGTVA